MLFRFNVESKVSINIMNTLFSGQSFLWNTFSDKNIYYYSIIMSVPIIIRQLSKNEFELFSTEKTINGIPLPDFIRYYFTLDIDINRAFPKNFYNLYPDLWQLLMKYFSK